MTTKTLIIRLIANDLVHLRLLYALKRAGLETDRHHSRQTELIFELLGLAGGPEEEGLFEVYLEMSKEANVFASEKEVCRVARRIYWKLIACNNSGRSFLLKEKKQKFKAS